MTPKSWRTRTCTTGSWWRSRKAYYRKGRYADYICSIDKCGQTKHVVLPKIVPDTPSTPDTPDTPNTPSTPDTPNKPDTPTSRTSVHPEVTRQTRRDPDAVQADAVPADAAVTLRLPERRAGRKPEAAATAAVSAAALPQTGANCWQWQAAP